MKALSYPDKIIHLTTKYNVAVATTGGVTLTDYTGEKKLVYADVNTAHRAVFGY